MKNIVIRRATLSDAEPINNLFTTIFFPEKVGELAEIFFHYLPQIKNEYWFLAEDLDTKKLVSGFVLIPWEWQMDEIPLKVAELGIVGTLENYRGQGIMRRLMAEFNKTLLDEKFDLTVIQGIPGFYQQFGYRYALAMENHHYLPLHAIPDDNSTTLFSFKKADVNDIPYLMKEEKRFSQHHFLCVKRSIENWTYLLTYSLQTEYGSEFWIMETDSPASRYFFRITLQGFGLGLIISEVSQGITHRAMKELFTFCKKLCLERNKPYIRINLPTDSDLVQFAHCSGAELSKTYGWQIKIPNKATLLNKMIPVFEKRLNQSSFKNYSGIFRLNFYTHSIDLVWNNGLISDLTLENNHDVSNQLSIPDDLFPLLLLGYKSWEELQFIHPDVFPGSLYDNPAKNKLGNEPWMFSSILFPPQKSWIAMEY